MCWKLCFWPASSTCSDGRPNGTLALFRPPARVGVPPIPKKHSAPPCGEGRSLPIYLTQNRARFTRQKANANQDGRRGVRREGLRPSWHDGFFLLGLLLALPSLSGLGGSDLALGPTRRLPYSKAYSHADVCLAWLPSSFLRIGWQRPPLEHCGHLTIMRPLWFRVKSQNV
jgi:hypothetical protein